MTVLEALRNTRELFLAEQYPLSILFMPWALLSKAAGDNWELAEEVAKRIEECTPPYMSFQMFLDGGEYVSDDTWTGWVYHYNRTPEEIAAVIGKACAIAAREAA